MSLRIQTALPGPPLPPAHARAVGSPARAALAPSAAALPDTVCLSAAVAPPATPTPAAPGKVVAAASTPHGERPRAPVVLSSIDASGSVANGGCARSPESRAVAEHCHAIVFGAGTLEEKAAAITAELVPAIERAAAPDPSWTKATPEQVRLFVLETLEHTAGIRGVGALRGLDFRQHDFEGDSSKLNPEITQFIAKPGRDASVRWAIEQHNAAPHHRFWNTPHADTAELAESATDIINAWRMTRRVYDKPSWSWEKIEATIDADFDDGKLTAAQRDALIEAIPFQRTYEACHGWPT